MAIGIVLLQLSPILAAAACMSFACAEELNLRPIIGFLVEDFVYPDDYPDATSYLAASYVKSVEAAGARAAPIFLWRDEEYYRKMFEMTNGLVVQGGNSLFTNSDFSRVSKILWDLALSAPPERRKDFPIWGTCLGFEQLAVLSANVSTVQEALDGGELVTCHALNQRIFLNVSSYEEWSSSAIGKAMPESVLATLSSDSKRLMFSNHKTCLLPRDSVRLGLDRFWRVLSTAQDKRGVESVTLMEAREYPVWAAQFHPEKPAFEWSLHKDQIPHEEEAVVANAFFMRFFVGLARKSRNRFPSRKEEEAALIYNYSPTYIGKEGAFSQSAHYPLEQIYLFDDRRLLS